MIGSSDVGKTCLINRYIDGTFSQTVSTVGSAYFVKKEVIGDRVVTLGVWDTAGSERFASMSNIYYRNSAACLICWDLTNTASFQRLRSWVDEVLENVPDCKICLVGNKVDLISEDNPRAVPTEEVNALASSINAFGVFETSAKTGQNVNQVFHQIAEKWLEDLSAPSNSSDPSILLSGNPTNLSSCYC
uniref:Uncharacterized protein n=1 Tax=Arcella intermedia TaxID=1963864 RepID=A0A6B2LKE7_9EUKA